MYSILLVDDDFFALEGMKRGVHFQELGFENVYYCTSMASACKVLEQHPVDVLVTDIEMPGGSGLDLQKWVLAKGIKLVTIFLTCHASFEYAQDAIRLHIFDYILKPLRYLMYLIGKRFEYSLPQSRVQPIVKMEQGKYHLKNAKAYHESLSKNEVDIHIDGGHLIAQKKNLLDSLINSALVDRMHEMAMNYEQIKEVNHRG